MNLTLRRALIISSTLVVVISLFVLAACSSTSSASPTVDPQPATAPTPEDTGAGHEAFDTDNEGYALFVAKGCAACHGDNVEGTDAAPALPGHQRSQVLRQVRAPIGLMPVFPPDKVSNAELETLAEWVASLTGGHMHARPADVGQALAYHHWMALSALHGDNPEEARHHVKHIIEVVEGEHLSLMKKVLKTIETGDTHDAIHSIQEMLAGTVTIGISTDEMHLKLALSAARIDDAHEAEHHLEHYLDITSDHTQAENFIALLRAGEIAAAKHELESMLGDGTSEDEHEASDDQQSDDDAHVDGDEHETTEESKDGS